MTIENFKKTDFNFNGVYRGIVEDNADPLDSGRVRVRIRGLHPILGEDVPVEQLPWAEPAIGLYWSGGRNITNKDHKNDTPDKPESRYNPYPPARTLDGNIPTPPEIPGADRQPKNQEIIDNFGNACGTGGIFTVPKRGNWVFLFFEHGNHMNPIYFAMAPSKPDWDFQKEFRNSEVTQKIEQLKEFRKEFEPKEVVSGSDWAKAAKVDSRVERPKFNILPIDHSNDNTNRDVTCITSLNGTSIIIDNRLNREQIFVIHKNYMEYTDTEGNRKVYIGKERDKTQERVNDPDKRTNYEVGVEGNHELHVFGNYDLYAKGRLHIQCDSHVQIDAQKTVGVLSREGDVDVIIEKGNANLDIKKGNVDAHIGNNLNAHIKKNLNAKIDGKLNATVNGASDLTLKGSVKAKTGSVDLTVDGDAKVKVSGNTDIDSPDVRLSGNLHVGKDIKVGGSCDVKRTAKFGADVTVRTGISCGGYLRNRGEANLGSPVIAHGLNVVSGIGTGSGSGTENPQNPSAPSSPVQTQQETGNMINKNFEESDSEQN